MRPTCLYSDCSSNHFLINNHLPSLFTIFFSLARLIQPQQQQSNYFKAIHDSKEVLKLTSMLSSAILASRQDLMKVSAHTHTHKHALTSIHVCTHTLTHTHMQTRMPEHSHIHTLSHTDKISDFPFLEKILFLENCVRKILS